MAGQCAKKPTAHARTAITWTPEGQRKRGRPRTTRRRTVFEEMNSAGIWWVSATGLTRGRVIWKKLFVASCANGWIKLVKKLTSTFLLRLI